MNSLKTVTEETTGWKDVSVSEFLGLTEQERQYIELKLALRDLLKTSRAEVGLTQKQLAKRMNSSQSRVAKMEAGDPAVSIDLLVKALFQTGTTSKRLGTVIAESRASYS